MGLELELPIVLGHFFLYRLVKTTWAIPANVIFKVELTLIELEACRPHSILSDSEIEALGWWFPFAFLPLR